MKRYRRKSSFPLITGFLIAIIPKCSFCVLAYSSAITLCSGTQIYSHSPVWSSWISISLALLTILMILLNYRGSRTWAAVTLVIVGSLLIIRSELVTGDLTYYYWGVISLFAGIWMNGSFYFFYYKMIKPFWRQLIRYVRGGTSIVNSVNRYEEK